VKSWTDPDPHSSEATLLLTYSILQSFILTQHWFSEPKYPDSFNPDPYPYPALQVNPDTDPDPIRIQGFDDQNLKKKKIQMTNLLSFLDQKLQFTYP
jgi:hypothetical protein